MGITLDILGSIMVRTAIVLIVLRMNVSLNGVINETVSHATIQTELSILRDVMTKDFELAGWNVAGTAVDKAEVNQFKFYGDIDNDGTADLVRYYTGPKGELDNTQNPEDRRLYRQINNGTSLNVANGVIKCEFKYYDALGAETSDKPSIKMFSIKVIMQDGSPIEGKYPTTYWEQFFFPQNL